MTLVKCLPPCAHYKRQRLLFEITFLFVADSCQLLPPGRHAASPCPWRRATPSAAQHIKPELTLRGRKRASAGFLLFRRPENLIKDDKFRREVIAVLLTFDDFTDSSAQAEYESAEEHDTVARLSLNNQKQLHLNKSLCLLLVLYIWLSYELALRQTGSIQSVRKLSLNHITNGGDGGKKEWVSPICFSSCFFFRHLLSVSCVFVTSQCDGESDRTKSLSR